MAASTTFFGSCNRLICGTASILILLICTPARAELVYSYDYDFSQITPGIVGDLSFIRLNFISTETFLPAIYHTDPVNHPFILINFRNPFDPTVNGAPLSQTPVLDMILDGFSVGGFIGGRIDQFGTITGPGGFAHLTISPTVDHLVSYVYDYDFSVLEPGVVGSFSFVAPGFITTTSSFGLFSHDDPVNHPLEFFGLRNAFVNGTYDGVALQPPLAADLVLQGFSVGGLITGPLEHTGTFAEPPLQFTTTPDASLTISGTPDSVPEPASLALVSGALVTFGVIRRRTRPCR